MPHVALTFFDYRKVSVSKLIANTETARRFYRVHKAYGSLGGEIVKNNTLPLYSSTRKVT